MRDFSEFFDLHRYPQAVVIEKTCEGLDTSDETAFHETFYGCFQGYPFSGSSSSPTAGSPLLLRRDGQQTIGDMRTQTVREIL